MVSMPLEVTLCALTHGKTRKGAQVSARRNFRGKQRAQRKAMIVDFRVNTTCHKGSSARSAIDARSARQDLKATRGIKEYGNAACRLRRRIGRHW